MPKRVDKKKHPKGRRPLDYLIYLLVRTLAIFIQLARVDVSLRFARWLGGGLYRIYPRGRQRALENLRLSFPEKHAIWHERTARRSFEHLVMFAFDMLYTPRLLRRSNWRRCIKLPDISAVVKLLTQGRGVIMVTGHYGNFEVLGCALAALGLNVYGVARPLDNRYLNRYIYETLHHGPTIIYKKGATESMHRILTTGKVLGLVGDQNGSRKDVFVDFFGRQAATYKSIALLAMEYDVPIIVGCARRLNDRYHFEFDLARIIMPQEWQGQGDPLCWITAEWTTAIEEFVRRDPEQYWWIHRRWKTRPPQRTRLGQTEMSPG